MARGDITIRHEMRPCMYRRLLFSFDDMSRREYKDEKAIWHGWANADNDMWALLEFQDGHIEWVRAKDIRFVDDMFSEMYWPEGIM